MKINAQTSTYIASTLPFLDSVDVYSFVTSVSRMYVILRAAWHAYHCDAYQHLVNKHNRISWLQKSVLFIYVKQPSIMIIKWNISLTLCVEWSRREIVVLLRFGPYDTVRVFMQGCVTPLYSHYLSCVHALYCQRPPFRLTLRVGDRIEGLIFCKNRHI